MPSSKTLSSRLISLSDSHFWIAEPNLHDIAFIIPNVHRKLLRLAGVLKGLFNRTFFSKDFRILDLAIGALCLSDCSRCYILKGQVVYVIVAGDVEVGSHDITNILAGCAVGSYPSLSLLEHRNKRR